jgi:hypothetical protein
LVDWIGSHVCAFAFFGGVTAQLVVDYAGRFDGFHAVPAAVNCRAKIVAPGAAGTRDAVRWCR